MSLGETTTFRASLKFVNKQITITLIVFLTCSFRIAVEKSTGWNVTCMDVSPPPGTTP